MTAKYDTPYADDVWCIVEFIIPQTAFAMLLDHIDLLGIESAWNYNGGMSTSEAAEIYDAVREDMTIICVGLLFDESLDAVTDENGMYLVEG